MCNETELETGETQRSHYLGSVQLMDFFLLKSVLFSSSDKNSDPLKMHLKQMMDVSRVRAYRNECSMLFVCFWFFFYAF